MGPTRNDASVAYLQLGIQRGASDMDLIRGAIPSGAQRPNVAVPILAGKQIIAILFYFAHASGSALNPEEIGSLRKLAAAAGPLYRQLSDAAKREDAATLATLLQRPKPEIRAT